MDGRRMEKRRAEVSVDGRKFLVLFSSSPFSVYTLVQKRGSASPIANLCKFLLRVLLGVHKVCEFHYEQSFYSDLQIMLQNVVCWNSLFHFSCLSFCPVRREIRFWSSKGNQGMYLGGTELFLWFCVSVVLPGSVLCQEQ